MPAIPDVGQTIGDTDNFVAVGLSFYERNKIDVAVSRDGASNAGPTRITLTRSPPRRPRTWRKATATSSSNPGSVIGSGCSGGSGISNSSAFNSSAWG